MNQTPVKFLFRENGGMPFPESANQHDMMVSHNSFIDFRRGLARLGKAIIAVQQKGVEITEASYGSMKAWPPVAVLYRSSDCPPTMYNGFQG